MAKSKKIGGLGKGLSALIPDRIDMDDAAADGGDEGSGAGRQVIPLARISANPFQPRRIFDEEQLRELAASIAEHGVLQPVLVRPAGEGYQLIAGERRWRAAGYAGLVEIPALVREMSDHEMTEVSLVENIQRQDLDPVEEARAYRRLSEEFNQTQEQIAKRVSKSRAYIANSIRLLHLPALILDHLASGALTVGHVRPLLVLGEQDALQLADRLIGEQATAREAEQWAKAILDEAAGAESARVQESDGTGREPDAAGRAQDKAKSALPVELAEIQRILRECVQTKVEITRGARGGKIMIEYYTQDDIERILELLCGSREIS